MAGMIVKKLKASALMEAMAAVAIITMVIIMGTMIFVNVTGSSFTGEKIRAEVLLDKLSVDTKNNKRFLNEIFTDENITAKKKVSPYQGNEHLLLIHYQALDLKESVLAEKKEIVVTNEEYILTK